MRIYVTASPRSSRNKVEKIGDSEYKVYMTTAPVEGKANKQLIDLLADHFKVAKSCVTIVGGKSTKRKMVDILR